MERREKRGRRRANISGQGVGLGMWLVAVYNTPTKSLAANR